jgi:hypothetical protein
MPQVGFEPTIPVFERAKTLDRAATLIGHDRNILCLKVSIGRPTADIQ